MGWPYWLTSVPLPMYGDKYAYNHSVCLWHGYGLHCVLEDSEWVQTRRLFLVLCRSYTTIENPSHFFMTLSCKEAIQSFISHFNQYSLVDPSWGNIPSWVWQGLAIDLESYGAEYDTTVILETEFNENNNISISHPDKHKRNWQIVSTINVTYAPIQINWARNIASNYFSQ